MCEGAANQYHGLTKERPWAEHLTSLPRRVVCALSSVSALIHEEDLCHVYSDSLPSKQITGQIIMYKRGFKVKS